jgi:biofilm PGA synthesis N-glycosyltransferase PgaC
LTRGKHTRPIQAVKPYIVALVPAHNEVAPPGKKGEEEGIAGTVRSLLDQDYPIDNIVVISDNSTDDTVAVARQFPVTVIESEGLPDCCPKCTVEGKNTHRKSGALNQGWWKYAAKQAHIVVCADGDAKLPRHAVADWVKEFEKNPNLGTSSSQPVIVGGEEWEMRSYERPEGRKRPLHWINDRLRAFFAAILAWYLPRLQRFEFAKTIVQSLNRGFVLVSSGVGCAWRNEALWDVAREPGQSGPWTYESVVEDYHLTYQARRAGWECKMSRTVWCFTGSMKTIKSLWYQRIKWTGGTNADLTKFGCDRLNYRQWFQNVILLSNIMFWILWLSLEIPQIFVTGFKVNWWWQAAGVFFGALELIHMSRLREPRWRRDWKDWLLAGLMIHLFILTILSLSWGVVSWGKVLYSTLGDTWSKQYRAEGMAEEEEYEIVS